MRTIFGDIPNVELLRPAARQWVCAVACVLSSLCPHAHPNQPKLLIFFFTTSMGRIPYSVGQVERMKNGNGMCLCVLLGTCVLSTIESRDSEFVNIGILAALEQWTSIPLMLFIRHSLSLYLRLQFINGKFIHHSRHSVDRPFDMFSLFVFSSHLRYFITSSFR